MPLPFHIQLDPDRPITTVFTEIDPDIPDYVDPPEDIRTYATRGECLRDLRRWRKRLRRIDYEEEDEPDYDNRHDFIKHDSTCTFEVYEHERLRLAIQLQPYDAPVSFGPWADSPRPLDDEPAPPPPDRDNDAGGETEPGPGATAGLQWLRELKSPSTASRLMNLIKDNNLIPRPVALAIFETFEDSCERACPGPDQARLIDFDRIFRRAVERWLRNMDDTPERTWDTIKADYSSLYAAAGGDFDRLPQQDGFDALDRLVRLALGTAHYPDQHEDRIQALAQTIATLAARRAQATPPPTTSESLPP
ncbi:MAG: hypothetical protein F4Y01_06095 [Gammaproteobacteria bacterium]|nr:hypothetical protein [Gammaproteobacteria bacterium]